MKEPKHLMQIVATNSTSGLHYMRGGLQLLEDGLGLFLQIAIFFSIPALTSAAIAMAVSFDSLWKTALLFVLQSITTLVAPVVFMMAVGAVVKGDRASINRVFRRSLPWVPRYLWTNAHTSVIFWVPVGGLLLLQGQLSESLSAWSIPAPLQEAGWVVLLVAVGVVLHAHTLLAPFLAVHSDLPGSLAALESWRLARRHFRLILTTLLVASGPAIVLLAGVAALVAPFYGSLPLLAVALPYFVGVVLQCIRLTLMPAAYVLYQDLWTKELERRMQEGEPPVPQAVRGLLSLTSWIRIPAGQH